MNSHYYCNVGNVVPNISLGLFIVYQVKRPLKASHSHVVLLRVIAAETYVVE